MVHGDLSVLVNQPCQPWQSSRCLLLPQRWQEGQEERRSGGIDREEYPSSDKHYSGTSVSNQIQSTGLATLTSANKVDSTLVVLQGIHKVCERMACWSAYLLKHNSGFFAHAPCFMIFSVLTKFSAAACLLNYLQLSRTHISWSVLEPMNAPSILFIGYHDRSSSPRCISNNIFFKKLKKGQTYPFTTHCSGMLPLYRAFMDWQCYEKL